MNKAVSVGILFLGLYMLLSCTGDTTTVVTPEKEDNSLLMHQLVLNADTAIYSIHVAYQLVDNSDNYQQENITKIVLTYPHIDSFRNKGIMDSVNKIVLNAILSDAVGISPPANLELYMKSFIGDYKDYKKEMKEFGIHFSAVWFYDLKIDVLLNSPNLLSLQVNKLEFTGGAHANPWTSYLNIDLKTGKILELKELMVGDYEPELLMSAESEFRKETNLAGDSSLVDSPYEFSSGNFELPENFSIGRNGISFYYNPYDLGPYALGSTSFEIPYKELLDIINKEKLVLEAVKVGARL